MTEQRASFIKLPSDLLSLLLTDWLKWKEVARCDAAMCNRTGRAEWLGILQSTCIFDSISIGYKNSPNNLAWLASRFVRVKEINLGNVDIQAKANMERWLRSVVEVVSTTRDADFTLHCFVRFCGKLTTFKFYSYMGEEMWWDIIRNNPNLVELWIWGEGSSKDPCLPNDLSLPLLRKLSLDCDTLGHEHATVLLTQLPGLRSLQITRTRNSQNDLRVYHCLSKACPHLIHLDLRYAFDVNLDGSDGFAKLMKSLKLGLHTLILPTVHELTESDLQSVKECHGHSLRCLSISDNAECDMVGFLNSLPLLHTLELTSRCLRLWKRGQVANLSIVHLRIDACYMHSYDILDSLTDHCPSMNTLSLCRFEGSLSVEPFLRLLLHRHLVHTICVDDVDTMAQLQVVMPKINILPFVSLDIFTFAY